MLPLFVATTLGALIAVSAAMSTAAFDALQARSLERAERDLERLAVRLKERSITTGYPADLAGLLRAGETVHPALRYARASGLSDGVWTFDRAMLYVVEPGGLADRADFLTSVNACGAGAFDSAASYCTPALVKSIKVETKSVATTTVAETKLTLNRTMHKMLASYYRSGAFPNRSDSLGAFGPNEGVTMASFVGYSGDAATCSGTHIYVDVALDCGDLFERLSGEPIYYSYSNTSTASLFVQTRLRRANGQRVMVAIEALGS